MILELLLLGFVAIFIYPLCLLLHEIGHGILAVCFTKSDVHIYLGLIDEVNQENFRLGRLHFHIVWGYAGFTQWGGNLNKYKRAIVIAGGPIMSFLLVLFFEILVAITSQSELSQLFLISKIGCFFIFIMSVLPIPYIGGRLHGFPSDGLQLLQMLRSKKQ